MKKRYLVFVFLSIFVLLTMNFILADVIAIDINNTNNTYKGSCDLSDSSRCDNTCLKDSDCKYTSCSCYNKDITITNNNHLSLLCSDIGTDCKCENKKCITTNKTKPVCGDGICEENEKAVLCVDPAIDCKGEDCKGGCNIICPQDCNSTNKTLPGENKTKILPETASLRARERLGELGFNITLKQIANDKEYRQVYIAKAKKQGKLFGFIKMQAEVSAEIDSETGKVTKVHKPWWGFMAGI